MITNARLVGLLILPSPTEAAWRSAIGAAARASGWVFTKAGAAQPSSRDKPTMLLVNDLRAVPYDAVDAWCVIGATPDEAVTRSLSRKPWPLVDACRFSASQFADATAIIEQGGILLDNRAGELVFPGLGAVKVKLSTEPVPKLPSNPLAFYSTLPPAAGLQAEWPTSVFSYTLGQAPVGGGPSIDLTGRGRILIHGPYFHVPKGWWRITVRFAVEPENIAYLRFDWGAGTDVTSHHAELNKAGDYQLVLDHLWTTPGPAELRVWAERGHFLGGMTFHNCLVERLPDADDPF